METHEESVTWYRTLRIGNLIADEEDPDRRNVQAGLDDWIG
jgi:hypothetical protein